MRERCLSRILRRLAFVALASGLCVAAHLGCSPGPSAPELPPEEHAGWTLATPRPLYQDLNGVYAATRHEVWAVGNGGTIARFDGWNSATVPSGTDKDLYAIHGTGPADIFAVGDRVILHSDGNGWRCMTTTDRPLRGVWCRAPNDVTAVGDKIILHYDGSAWRETVVCPYNLKAVTGTKDRVFAVGGKVLAVNVGTTWDFTEQDRGFRCVIPIGYSNGVLAGGSDSSGVFLFGWDAFAGWRLYERVRGAGPLLALANLPTDDASWGCLAALPGQIRRLPLIEPAWQDATRQVQGFSTYGRGEYGLIYGVGTSGTLVLGRADSAAPGGVSWENFYAGPGDVHATRLFLGGPGVVLATTDTGHLVCGVGEQWSAIDTGADARIYDVCTLPDGSVYAVGEKGAMVRGSAQGGFTRLDTGCTGILDSVWGSNVDDIWVGAWPDGLLHWDGGAWRHVATGLSYPDHVRGMGRDDVWVCNYYQGMAHWNGTTWASMPAPNSVQSLLLMEIDRNSGTIVTASTGYTDDSDSTYGGVVHRVSGSQWEDVTRGVKMPVPVSLLVLGRDDIYVGTNKGIWHFDGGAWSRLPGLTKAVEGLCGNREDGLYASSEGVVWHRALP